MAKTARGLVDFMKKIVSRPYIYATYGKILTEASLAWCVKTYPSRFSDKRIAYAKAHYIGKRTDDCEGSIKNYLWLQGDTEFVDPNNDPVYNAKQDLSANGAYNLATVKGDISTMPDRPGICVHKNGHVGVYIGRDSNNNMLVCEAQGFDYGVRINLLKDRPFVHWFEHPWIDYTESEDTCMVELPILKKGMKGIDSVGSWQMLLRGYNYKGLDNELIKVDEDFGDNTEYATKQVQRVHRLPQTGVVDSDTWRKLIV